MKDHGRTIFRVCLVLAVVVGIYGRVHHFGQRPFWGDEAWVADTVLHNSYAQLFRQTEVPLPPLFSLAVKAIHAWYPHPETSLRLFPLLCGIALLPTAYLLLRTLRVPQGTLFSAMCLLSSSTMLVVWSRELKQYQVEAFTATLYALLVFRLRRSEQPVTRWMLGAGIVLVSVVGPWLGYGFVFAGASLPFALILLRPVAGSRRFCVVSGLVALLALGTTTLILFKFVAAAQGSHPGLMQFTSHWYIKPLDMHSWVRAGGYFCLTFYCMVLPQMSAAVIDQAGVPLVALVAIFVWLLIGIGIWAWARRSRAEMCVYLLGPWGLLFAAALLGKYPFCATRMMLMWTVPMMIVVAAGIVHTVRTVSIIVWGKGRPGIVAALVISFFPVLYCGACPVNRSLWVYHDFPQMLSVLRQRRLADEPLVTTLGASPAVRHYADRLKIPAVCMPTDGGTCAIPGFSYRNLIERTVRDAGYRLWVLTLTYEDQTRTDLMRALVAAGYKVELEVEDTHASVMGRAQLYRADRH